MKGLTWTPKELARLEVLNGMVGRLWPVTKAAEVLGVPNAMSGDCWTSYRREEAAAPGIMCRLDENKFTEISDRVDPDWWTTP